MDELPADGEAEAGPAVAPGHGGVRLRERLEEPPDVRGTDADARVTDGAAQAHAAGGRRLGGHPHLDLAVLGELQGVADQVREHLAETVGVPTEARRNVGADDGREIEAPVAGLLAQELDRLFDEATEIEVDALQVELPGLDLGEVQDVVDDPEEGVGRALHGFGVAALLGGQRCVEEQGRHPDDPVHRRPDLVAHGRQEGGLRPIGRQGVVPGAGELGGHGLGDAHGPVAGRGEHSHEAEE